jgi:Carboxypeptidase regulatory-like domain
MRIGEGKARGVLLIAAALAMAAVLWAQAEARGRRTAVKLKPEPSESGEPVMAVPQATVTGTGEIAGIVTDAGTGKPISGARVMVFEPPPAGVGGVGPTVMQYPCTGCEPVGQLRYHTATDPQGRYRIQVEAPGWYVVHAAANGFAQQAYGVSNASWDGMFKLRTGERRENVDIQLPYAAVLTGRVTDKRGEAIPSAYLLLEWRGLLAWERKRWLPVAMMATDDRGIYRVYGLAAGRYRIEMRCERGLQLSTNVPGSLGYALFFNNYSPEAMPQSFSPLYYYPGVTEAGEAKTITLEAGEVRRGVDMSVAAMTPVKPEPGIATGECAVSGTVTDATTSKALGNAWVSWGSTRAYERPGGFETQTDAKGRFAFHGLPCFDHAPLRAWKVGYVPAEYPTMQVYGQRPWWWWLPPPGSRIPTWNVENVRLELAPEGAITGRITDLQGKPQTLVRVEAVRLVRPVGHPSYLWECCGTLTDEEGKYRIFGLAPGEYYVAAQFQKRAAQAGDLYSGTYLFNPGRVKVDDAHAIRLKAGETVEGINFTGEPPETHSISGGVRGYARDAFKC